MSDDEKLVRRRGVHKFEDKVFHFPKFDDPVLPDGTVLRDFVQPHPRVVHDAGGPSLTRQDMAEECDINNIMARYEHTGILPEPAGEPYYADYTSVPATLQEAMQQIQDASDAFMTLPAAVRKEFDNDPYRFVEYASSDDNLDQMRNWGLAPPKPAPKAPEPAPAAPGASASSAPGSSAAPAGASPAASAAGG